jgi:hypothetical protein
MSNLIDGAVKVLRGLADDQQATAARAIINHGAYEDELQLTDEQVAEIQRRMANPDRKIYITR